MHQRTIGEKQLMSSDNSWIIRPLSNLGHGGTIRFNNVTILCMVSLTRNDSRNCISINMNQITFILEFTSVSAMRLVCGGWSSRERDSIILISRAGIMSSDFLKEKTT